MLRNYLKRIDDKLSAKSPQVAAALRPGADESKLKLLRHTVFRSGELPDDLATLFRWHDGQNGYNSLSPLDNRMLMSIEDVADAWTFLSDPNEDIQQPWDETWVPVLSNGAGDYIVYVSTGELRGKLLAYWHDSTDRSMKFASLEHWAQKVLVAFEG